MMDDKQRRQSEEAQTEIPFSERQELESWLLQDYKETVQ